MKVRHAKLLNVFGKPAKYGGFTIMPALVELDGRSFSPSYPLRELPPGIVPPILRVPIQKHYDVAWVYARLPSAFGFSPEPSESEKTLLDCGFVAVPDGTDEAVAFWCSDYYGRTSLMFSDSEMDEEIKSRAAQAFWAYLISEPDQLGDFQAEVMHLGASVTLHFGCEDGEPYLHET